MAVKRFGTFEGVFTPTFLSILGVIMYLRLGWVVGTVGLRNALFIIAIANLITIFTCLCVSSIATNMRIGAGGAYAIISKSLGLEIGGAIGIPLYLSQAISVAFYVTGFTECWVSVFPNHTFIVVSIITWFILLLVSYASAKLAFRLQYGIIAIVVFSLVSFFLGKTTNYNPSFFREGLEPGSFWAVFAIFFPAVTGILAGLSMSGELRKPERNIPLGMLSAVGVTFIIYVLLAFRFSYAASSRDLAANTSIIIDLGRWPSLVVAGIMGATISSALSMFVASPRTLSALGKYHAVPFSYYFSRMNKRSEPTNAIIFTALLSFITIALGTLDKIAGLLTMFFLITYAMLNLSVFIEQLIGIPSFRPAFKINIVLPFLGGAGSVFAMFLINPVFSAVAIVVIIAIYLILIQREVRKNWPDVRKGLFIFIAEQAMKIATNLPYHPKIWKPNLLIPVEEAKDWSGMVDFLRALTFPSGRITLFKVIESDKKDKDQAYKARLARSRKKYSEELLMLTGSLKQEGILASSSMVDSDDFLKGATVVTQALKDSLFPPNVLFAKLSPDEDRDASIEELIMQAESFNLGVVIFIFNEQFKFGQKKLINLWIREGSPNIHLGILMALQLQENWEARIRLINVAADDEERIKAQSYLSKVKKTMRMSKDTETRIIQGTFLEAADNAPLADINIFGMPEEVNIKEKRFIAKKLNTPLLFLRDSKQESAIA